ncbi:MAG: ribbon-helix-helix protein, CopG family [Desulfobacterales bacterium]|nr:MAG: ribbon-helix-helix protein, CopG family [Desulfobacterales bacterium]
MSRFVHPITFKVPEEIKQKLKKLAEEDRRPLSNLIRNIVLDWLAEQEAKAAKTKKRAKKGS